MLNQYALQPESVHDVVFDEGELGVDLEHPGTIARSKRRPGDVDVVGHRRRGHAGLRKVRQERGEDVPRELRVTRRHLQVLAPDPVEDILEVVPMSHSHVNLLEMMI